jgi:hypothetical protein
VRVFAEGFVGVFAEGFVGVFVVLWRKRQQRRGHHGSMVHIPDFVEKLLAE